MSLKWYVVHVYSGHEQKVKVALEEQIEGSKHPEKFGEILIPPFRGGQVGIGAFTNFQRDGPALLYSNRDDEFSPFPVLSEHGHLEFLFHP